MKPPAVSRRRTISPRDSSSRQIACVGNTGSGRLQNGPEARRIAVSVWATSSASSNGTSMTTGQSYLVHARERVSTFGIPDGRACVRSAVETCANGATAGEYTRKSTNSRRLQHHFPPRGWVFLPCGAITGRLLPRGALKLARVPVRRACLFVAPWRGRRGTVAEGTHDV